MLASTGAASNGTVHDRDEFYRQGLIIRCNSDGYGREGAMSCGVLPYQRKTNGRTAVD